MSSTGATTVAPSEESTRANGGGTQGGGGDGGPPGGSGRGFFAPYKPEQGIWTRRCTFAGLGLMIAWGAVFLSDRIGPPEGDGAGEMLISFGIPIAFMVVMGSLAWRISFVKPRSSDFMIATEGEMKKVNWSTKAEVAGSTKVVILFTVLMALLLFAVDALFKWLFSSIGVLKI